jgi:uncharacterized protein (TIGR03084 family)
MLMEIIDDLVAEQERLEAILAGLSQEQWLTESAAPGWTVADVVLHLAHGEESVLATTSAGAPPSGVTSGIVPGDVDGAMNRLVEQERTTPEATFDRWRAARRAAVDALRAADPAVPVVWVAMTLKPRTLATTRLAEHWAHALDVATPLGVPLPDTDRLRHVAWLAHATLPYAFAVAGEPVHPVFCELTGPDGSTWRFGPPDAESTITGDAGVFCRVGARRLAPEDSGLVTTGPHGAAALRVVRTYAA